MRSSRGRGFSLIELLLVLGLLGLVMVTGLNREQHRNVESRALAEVFAETLRSARLQAVAAQEPVVVALSTGGDPDAMARSIYLLRGWTPHARPRSARDVRDFSQEYRGMGLWVGDWALDPARSRWGAVAAATTPPVTSARAEVDLAGWTAAVADPFLLFTPSGTVLSRGLPTFDGEYHVLAAANVISAGGRLAAADQPCTVSVGALGGISFGPGIVGAPDALLQASTAGRNGRAGSAVTPEAPSTSPTLVGTPRIGPTPPANVASGTDTLVSLDGYVTLKVQARDEDGDPLFLEGVELSGTGGTFSSAGQPMEWNPGARCWEGVLEYRLPSGPAGPFRVAARVRDPDGHSVSTEATPLVVALAPRGKLFLTRGVAGPGGVEQQLFQANADGSEVTRITDVQGLSYARVSPDGQRIMYRGGAGAGDAYFVCYSDGSNACQVTNRPGTEGETSRAWTNSTSYGDWSWDSTRIVVTGTTDPGNKPVTTQELVVLNPTDPKNPGAKMVSLKSNGSQRIKFDGPAEGGVLPFVPGDDDGWTRAYFPTFSPDDKTLVFTRWLTDFSLWSLEIEGEDDMVKIRAPKVTVAKVGPDGRVLMAVDESAGKTEVRVAQFSADYRQLTQETTWPGDRVAAEAMAWSPSGTEILSHVSGGGGDGMIVRLDLVNGTSTQVVGGAYPLGWWESPRL